MVKFGLKQRGISEIDMWLAGGGFFWRLGFTGTVGYGKINGV